MPKFMPRQKTRVFIVDEAIVASTVAAILQRGDFQVNAFVDGEKAWKAARIVMPDLVIAESEMLPLSGIDLAQRLQKYSPDCKILLFSGQPNSIESLEAARINGLKFETFPKPVNPKELLGRVQEMMATSSRTSAKERALKAYSDNAQETLSQLKRGSGFRFSK